VETTDVVELGLLDKGPDVGLLQVLKLVLIGRGEMSAHAAVVAGDNDTALSGGLDIVDTVLGVDTSLLAGLLEDLAVLVLTDTANVEDGVVGEQVLYRLLIQMTRRPTTVKSYLSTTGSVLSGAAGNQLSIPGHELLVEAHVLLLGEDGIVCLELVLLEKSGITGNGMSASELVDNPLKLIRTYPRAWMSRGTLAVYSNFFI